VGDEQTLLHTHLIIKGDEAKAAGHAFAAHHLRRQEAAATSVGVGKRGWRQEGEEKGEAEPGRERRVRKSEGGGGRCSHMEQKGSHNPAATGYKHAPPGT
jgi:hypothetical protein